MKRGTLRPEMRPVRIGRFWFVEIEKSERPLRRLAYARLSSADQKSDLDR